MKKFIKSSPSKEGMDRRQTSLALDLLVKGGNTQAVKEFAATQKVKPYVAATKYAEAHVYGFMKLAAENPGEVYGQAVKDFFDREPLSSYLPHAMNNHIFEDLLDFVHDPSNLEAVLDNGMSTVLGIDIIAAKAVQQGIRKNLYHTALKRKMQKFVEGAYGYVLTPSGTGRDFKKMFDIVDLWRDLIDPAKIVRAAMQDYADRKIHDNGYDRTFIYRALDTLIQLTNRKTVTALALELFEKEDCKKLVAAGKIDFPNSTSSADPSHTNENHENQENHYLLQEYEKKSFPLKFDVEKLVQGFEGDLAKYLPDKMAQWFRQGHMEHLLAILNHAQEIYDPLLAKEKISEAVAEAARQRKITRLTWVLEFPSIGLLDEQNKDLEGVIGAYKAYHQKNEQKNEQ